MSAKKRRKPYRKYKTYRRKGKSVKKSSFFGPLFSKIFGSIIPIVSISALILAIVVLISNLQDPSKSILNRLTSTLFTLFNKNGTVGVVGGGGGHESENFNEYSVEKEEILRICIIADIHQDIENLNKALVGVKNSECSHMFVIGDLTNYGDVPSLKEVRDVLSGAGLEYYVIPGDHDLADSSGPLNFKKVFGENYKSVGLTGIKFVFIDNSANFTVINDSQMSWIKDRVEGADFVVMAQPLFVEGLKPPFSSTYMGSMLNVPESDALKKKQQDVLKQGEDLLGIIRKSSVLATISAEHHRSSKLQDPVRGNLTHYVIGAVTSVVNDFPQSAIQTSRFSILKIYEDKSYLIEDITLD